MAILFEKERFTRLFISLYFTGVKTLLQWFFLPNFFAGSTLVTPVGSVLVAPFLFYVYFPTMLAMRTKTGGGISDEYFIQLIPVSLFEMS